MKKTPQSPQRMDVRIYSYWQALYMSFYSKFLYIDVAKRWRGIGAIYLLIMIAVASIPLSARLMLNCSQYVNQQIIEPLKTAPPLEIQHGTFVYSETMPYYIRNKLGSVVAVIDTRTDGNGMVGLEPSVIMLITRDKLYFRSPSINLFPNVSQKTVEHDPVIRQPEPDQNQILRLDEIVETSKLQTVKWAMLLIIYPIIVAFIFGVILSFFPMVAMLGQVLAFVFFRFKLKFFTSLRLLIVSSTAQISIALMLLGLNLFSPVIILLCLTLWMAYFSYAILIVKRDSLRITRS